ncbi:MAG TPA: DNA repair protein RecN [Verrucomicrobiales bacterium]|nr:DNA repair protein RecN [Verrucomicrobiales bacterium]
MLTTLSIKNLALVESLTWEIGGGLVGITGETGAGKSIIVGALKLVLGERADRDLIRTGEEQCTVEAVFETHQAAEINAVLRAAGLEECEGDQLIVKRVISAGGQNRQFINCAPATLQVLKSLGQYLVDLHGPHEHQSLNSRDRQMAMLDAAAGAGTALDAYQKGHRRWRTVAAELEELSQSERAGEQELELLRYQVQEIDSAALRADEEEPLLQRHRMASNSTRLVELTAQALGLLSDADSAVLVQLAELRRVLRDIERTDRGVAEVAAGFENAFVELEDLERGLRRYNDDLEIDPREVKEIEERINTIETLKRKYGGSIERVLDHRDAAAAKLGKIEGRGGELERLTKELAAARDALQSAGTALGQLRRKAAPRLAKEVSRHLSDLGFLQAKFTVELSALPQPGAHGLEEVDFMFAPNPGEPAKPLRVIASSGEMSRVMLAVKSALAKEDSIPLLVFDEIDANVGGEIAAAVGRKMAELGRTHQIISITHMPQVAALASCHYVVTKTVKQDRTFSDLRRVEGESRIDEITRMLGGKAASARVHAQTLLSGK